MLNLESNETIIFKVRKHWFILAVEMAGLVLIALLPLLLYGMGVGILMGKEALPAIYGEYVIAFYTIWLILIWIALFSVWTNYYLDVWTLTDKRLIAVDQQGLFNRTTASFRLERLQDVIVSVNGIIATFLGFGTVEIQTAGENGNFKIHGLPRPETLKAHLLDAAGAVHTTPGGV